MQWRTEAAGRSTHANAHGRSVLRASAAELSSACHSSAATHTSIMMTASAMVRRVVPPMNAPAPNSANTPGSIHAHGLGGRNTLAELQQGREGFESRRASSHWALWCRRQGLMHML
jgi:hypothetical protein